MFSVPRFIRYLQWLWLRSPSWYLVAPFAAATVFAVFFYFSIGPYDGDWKSVVPRFGFDAIGPWAICAFIFGSIFTAIHLSSRHLASNEEAISFLSMPVSTFERWLGSLIGLVVAIPLFSLINIMGFYALLGLFRGIIPYPFPDFSSIWLPVQVGMLSYLAMIPLAFAVGVLKPKRAIVWYIVVGVILSIAIPITISIATQSQEHVLIELPNVPAPENLVGLSRFGSYTEAAIGFAMGTPIGYLVPLVATCFTCLLVHYIGLRHKQV
ncbi:MAG: hypothetical protein AAF741_19375 [Bacteroidota bacterium]